MSALTKTLQMLLGFRTAAATGKVSRLNLRWLHFRPQFN